MPVRIVGNGGHARVIREALAYPRTGLNRHDGVALAIGDNRKRRELFDDSAVTVIHRAAEIASTAVIRRGAQIMAGAVIGVNAMIGYNTIVNTNASVDHDCAVGAHCHIAPGAVLCGGVKLGDGCFIGAGSVVIQGVTLEENTFVPAGSLVVKQDDIRRPVRVVRDRTP